MRADAGDRAGRERDAERPDARRDALGAVLHHLERRACPRELARHLVHEERPCHPARPRRVGERDIVGHDDHLDA
jgi:hypothetical protein